MHILKHFCIFSRLKYHRDDPSVTAEPYRQYILFLTPKGPLNDKLNEFWSASLKQCGRNAFHDCFPHITLTRFFQVCTKGT